MTAHHTREQPLGLAISPGNMAAGGTLPGRVPGVDIDHGDTGTFRLVIDEPGRLMESPAVMCSPLLLPDRCPCANTREFLEGGGAVRVFGPGNDGLAGYMAHMGGEPLLLPVPFLQETLGRLRSLRLELLPYAPVPGTDREKVVRREIRAVGESGDVHYAPVDADDVVEVPGLGVLDVACGMEIELPVHENEVRLPLLGPEELLLPLPAGIGDLQPPANRPDGDELFVREPGEDPAVVCDRTQGPELPLLRPVQSIGVSHLHDTLDGHLGGQAEGCLHALVEELLEGVLPEGPGLPCLFRDVVAGLVRSDHRLTKEHGLPGSGHELCLGGEFHENNMTHFKYRNKCKTKETGIPPPPYGRGLLPGKVEGGRERHRKQRTSEMVQGQACTVQGPGIHRIPRHAAQIEGRQAPAPRNPRRGKEKTSEGEEKIRSGI